MPTIKGRDINRWVTVAQREMPGLAITAIYPTYELGEPVTVQGQWQARLVRERTNHVFIDPATDAPVATRVGHQLSVGERIVHTADPLHFGTFGRPATKLLWVIFGLLLTGMTASGASIYTKRTKQAIGAGIQLGWLDFLGPWKWPNVLLITTVPVISFFF